jgi:hypothetical protein
MPAGRHADDLTTLGRELGEAERRLRDLLDEQLDFPKRIRAATDSGDRRQILGVQRRQDELPQHIAVARARILQLQIRMLEVEQGEAEISKRRLQQDVATAWEAYEAARIRWEVASHRQTVVEAEIKGLAQRINRLKMQLERCLTESDSGQRRVVGPGWRYRRDTGR